MSDYNPYAVHARALGAFQAKMGTNCPTFLWNQGNPIAFDGTDQSWNISPSTVTTKETLSTGGFQPNFTLRFSALAAQFYVAPGITTPDQLRRQLSNSPIGYLGGAYKITDVDIAPNGLVLTIDANAQDQNA